MKRLNNTFNTLLPSAEELWNRGGAEMREIEIDPGHTEDVPFFDLEVQSEKEIDSEPFVTRSGQEIGRQVVSRVITSDGIDRLVRVIRLADKHRTGGDFTVTDGTAWTTTINGYAGDRAERIAVQTRVDVVQIGSEHSASLLPYGLDALRLGKTICEASKTSLAKTAQSEQLILSHVIEKFGLASGQYAIGDSRGSMKTPGQYPYAEFYGGEIVHMDTKAPCIPEKLTLRDMPRFMRWLGTEALGGSAVIAKLIAEGEANTLRGTTSANPNFIASSLIGVMPALASGEAGAMVEWVPRNAHGHIVIYDKDGLSLGDLWDQQWKKHPNVYLKHVPRKTHAHLLERRAHDLQVGRIERFSDQYDSNGADLTRLDWTYVYTSYKSPESSQAVA